MATISEGNSTFQEKEEKEVPEEATNSTQDEKEEADEKEADDKESSAAMPGPEDKTRLSFQEDTPGSFRLTGITLASEEHAALAEAVAASVAAKLAASIRWLMAPLLEEQERRLTEALQCPVSELSFGGSRKGSSPQGWRGGRGSSPPSPKSPKLQPLRKGHLNPSDFNTEPVTFTTDPALPTADDHELAGLHNSTASRAGHLSPRAQTMENIGLTRQTSPTPRGTPSGPMPSFHRLVSPVSNNGELAFQKTPSMERRMSFGQRWAKWRNLMGAAGSNTRQPNGLQSLEDARATELLKGMAEEQENRDAEERRSTPREIAPFDGTQRVSTSGRLPTLPKLFAPGPTRVSTCPDVSGFIEQNSPGASGSGTQGGASSSKGGDAAQKAGEHEKKKDDQAWLNLPGMNGLKQVLQGRRVQENEGERYAAQEAEGEEDHQAAKAEAAPSFVVRIDRRGVKKKLGIDVKRDGDMVVITGIHTNGLVAAVNKGLTNQVMVGDRILEVNGNSIGILETLSASQALTLHLQRGCVSRTGTQQELPDQYGSEEPHTGERRTGERRSGSQGPRRSDRRTKTARSSGQDAASAPAGFSSTVPCRDPSDQSAETARAVLAALPPDVEDPLMPVQKTGSSMEEAARQAAMQVNLSQTSPASRTSTGSAELCAQKNTSSSDLKRSGSIIEKPPDRSTSRRLTGGFTKSEATALRMEREDELLNDLTESAMINQEIVGQASMHTRCEVKSASISNERKVRSPLILCLCGVLPWENSACCFYQNFVVLLAAGCVVVFAEHLYHAQKTTMEDGLCDAGSCLQFQEVTDAILAVGSLLGMLALRALTCPTAKLLGSSSALLVSYARRQGVVEKWVRAARWQTLQIVLLWACSVAFRVMMVYPARDSRELTSTILFAFVSVIFMGATYGILHVSCAIAIMIDSYCMHLHNDPDSAKGVREWNMLQALLRKASRAVERGFMVLQTTALAVLLLSASDLFVHSSPDFWWLLSNVLLAISVGLNFFKAAEVTEKCTRVPSLVNSLTFNHDMDVERHFLVEYVTYSMAGFYVGEVRLTAAMALKITYVSVLAAFGLLTRLTAAL